MKVTLRQRNQGRKTSLYLDYYIQGKRKTEYLKLYLEPNPQNKLERDKNKKTLQLAQNICAQRQLEMQTWNYGFHNDEQLKGSIIQYMRMLTEKRINSHGNWGSWDSMVKHLQIFSSPETTFADLDTSYVQNFKEYLDNTARTKGNHLLSQNSKYSYFNKFRAGLKQALKDGIISHNPAENVKGFSQADTRREFLTMEELQAIAKTPCELPQLKTAFLFSCLSGLRWSDISKLSWSEIHYSKQTGYYIHFRQKKTKNVSIQPISQQAVSLLGEPRTDNRPIFEDLDYSARNNIKLRQWIEKAGITKTITFHCARHTYATLQLTMGTDIYTVSKLLGHRELKTTQIYARVIDQKKQEAANRIKLDL